MSIDKQSRRHAGEGVSISVYNLRETNETSIYERGEGITVAAGYEERIDTIFKGTVQRVIRERESMESIVRIQAGDEVHAVERLRGVTCRTYAGPARVRQIVADLVTNDLGLAIGPSLLSVLPTGATRTDWSWSGPTDSALNNLLRPLDLYFFEDDGVVRIAGKGAAQPDAPRVQVQSIEIINKPIVTDEGAELTLFMRPEIAKGSVLTVVDSPTLSGDWRVAALRHNGDNWEGEFATWCDLRTA